MLQSYRCFFFFFFASVTYFCIYNLPLRHVVTCYVVVIVLHFISIELSILSILDENYYGLSIVFMAFLIKSAINYTRLTTQVKHLVPVIPQLKFAFTPNMSSTSSSEPNTIITAMNKHGVVPDVIPVAPEEEVEVNFELYLSSH